MVSALGPKKKMSLGSHLNRNLSGLLAGRLYLLCHNFEGVLEVYGMAYEDDMGIKVGKRAKVLILLWDALSQRATSIGVHLTQFPYHEIQVQSV